MGLVKSRLQTRYDEEIRPALLANRGYSNVMMVPRIQKVVVKTLQTITGQRPLVTKARKSISNFKIRAGMKIGAMVTLRGHLMWHFLDKLMNVTLPRVRDFQGVSVKNFDGRGNYNLGLKDQLVFPEIIFDEIEFLKGLQITIVTSANNNIDAAHLLSSLGMPFSDYETAAKVA
jgi:large subunit ribosomal protein L5